MLKVAADRVMLLLLDHDRHRVRSLDLEVEQGVAFTQDHPGFTALHLERGRILSAGVDDTWNLAVTPEAAGGPGAEFSSRRCGKGCAL